MMAAGPGDAVDQHQIVAMRLERGKGGRYRNAMLSEDLLALLREWWKVGGSRA